MHPKKTTSNRQSSTEGQGHQEQNMYENLIKMHNIKGKKNSRKPSKQKEGEDEDKRKKQMQTKLPYRSHKQMKKIVNRKNQQRVSDQTCLHFYEYANSESQGQGQKQRQSRMRQKKIKLLEKIAKIQIQKVKLRNQYNKICKRLNKNWILSQENDISEGQLEGKYVIYHQSVQKPYPQRQNSLQEDVELTDVVLYKEAFKNISDFEKKRNQSSDGQALVTNNSQTQQSKEY